MKKEKIISTIILLFLTAPAFASQTAQYPWAVTLQKIQQSISGPVAYTLAGILIVGCGFMMAFADLQGGAKKAVQVALGVSIAFGATTILSSLFTFTGTVI